MCGIKVGLQQDRKSSSVHKLIFDTDLYQYKYFEDIICDKKILSGLDVNSV